MKQDPFVDQTANPQRPPPSPSAMSPWETTVKAVKIRKLLGKCKGSASVNVDFNKTQDKAATDIDWQFSVSGLFDIREHL